MCRFVPAIHAETVPHAESSRKQVSRRRSPEFLLRNETVIRGRVKSGFRPLAMNKRSDPPYTGALAPGQARQRKVFVKEHWNLTFYGKFPAPFFK
jgi:hypothetical protein